MTWPLVAELRQRLGRYVHFGEADAVAGADVVPIAERVLRLTSQEFPNGPAGLGRAGVNAVCGIFLCRRAAAGDGPDPGPELKLLRAAGLTAPEREDIRVLATAEALLLDRSWSRMATPDTEELVSAETSWEMDLLDRVSAELAEAGSLAPGETTAAYCLASQHWLRYLALPPEDGDAELDAALAGFARIYRPEATVVPPPVREYLETAAPLTGGLAPLGRPRGEAPSAARTVLRARRRVVLEGTGEAEVALGRALSLRGSLAGRADDLDEAIERCGPVWAELRAEPGPALARAAAALVSALTFRGMLGGGATDLSAARDVGLVSADGLPADSPDTWELITALAGASAELAPLTRSPDTLNPAIGMTEAVLRASRDAHVRRPNGPGADDDLYVQSLFLVSLLYRERYELSGDPGDLEIATRAGSTAANEGSQSGSAWQVYGPGLAETFFLRYQAGHDPGDLDQAITIMRTLMWHAKLRDRGDPMLAERDRLGQWLVQRFNLLGYSGDYTEAIEHASAVAEAAEATERDGGAPGRAMVFSNAASLMAGSASSAEQAQRAVRWARRALAGSAPGSETASVAGLALSRGLRKQHEHEADRALLDEAVDGLERLLAGPMPDPLRADAAYELVCLLVKRDGADDPATLRAAQAAVDAAPPGRLRDRALLMLALSLLPLSGDAGAAGQDPAVRRRGLALLRDVALGPREGFRVDAALRWASEAVADADFAAAAEAYRAAIEGLPSPLWWAGSMHERRKNIAKLSGVARAAAACALRVGQREHALESLERGRAMLWSQAMQMRAAAARVAVVDPPLGERFAEALTAQEELARLESPQTFPDYMGATLIMMQQSFDKGRHPQDMRLGGARHWQSLVEQARGHPGLADIMRAPGAAELRGAAAGGVAVLINVNQLGSHALIVRPEGLDSIPLPGLTVDRTRDVVTDFWLAVHQLDLGVFDVASRRRAEATMAGTRGWLWDSIVGPVLDHLGLRDTPGSGEWPRVWWCPTAELSMLPLHAAGEDAGGACALDRVVSSYTVTLTTLVDARARAAATGATGARSILALDAGQLRGAPALPGAAQELADLQACFPGEVTVLSGSRAAKSMLYDQMKNHSWLHLACHARQGLGDHPPSLYLNDGPLGIDHLGWSASSEAALAYLSACSTAETAMDLADEAHHLAAAFQTAGFRHVIATQWGANDRVGVRVAREFYRRLHDAGSAQADAAAHALHHAVRAARAEGGSAYLWAPFVHYGL